jgi:hypothetical protein
MAVFSLNVEESAGKPAGDVENQYKESYIVNIDGMNQGMTRSF